LICVGICGVLVASVVQKNYSFFDSVVCLTWFSVFMWEIELFDVHSIVLVGFQDEFTPDGFSELCDG
jgi:hypothetical protein